MIMGQDEKEDFEESIRRNNFDENDFEIKEEDTSTPNPDGTYSTRYTEEIKITVTRKSNGKQKTYQGGDWTTWNQDFEKDLKSDVFGSP